MEIISFEQIRVHHSLDLLPEPDDQLHAGGHQGHTSQTQDGAQDYEWANIVMILPISRNIEFRKSLNFVTGPEHLPTSHSSQAQQDKENAGHNQEGNHMPVSPSLPEGIEGPPVHPPQGGLLQGGGDKLHRGYFVQLLRSPVKNFVSYIHSRSTNLAEDLLIRSSLDWLKKESYTSGWKQYNFQWFLNLALLLWSVLV